MNALRQRFSGHAPEKSEHPDVTRRNRGRAPKQQQQNQDRKPKTQNPRSCQPKIWHRRHRAAQVNSPATRHIRHDCLRRAAFCKLRLRAPPLLSTTHANDFFFSGALASNAPTPCATLPQYIVVFSLDTTVALGHNPRQHLSVTGELGSRYRPSPQKALRPLRENDMQFLPGFTVQCINPQCEARGHWLRE